MRLATITIMTLVLTLAVGCNRDQAATVATTDEVQTTQEARELTPEQLGALGAAIEKQPERADELLAEQGLTRETFEEQIRRVTEDPEASRQYAQAYENARA